MVVSSIFMYVHQSEAYAYPSVKLTESHIATACVPAAILIEELQDTVRHNFLAPWTDVHCCYGPNSDTKGISQAISRAVAALWLLQPRAFWFLNRIVSLVSASNYYVASFASATLVVALVV